MVVVIVVVLVVEMAGRVIHWLSVGGRGNVATNPLGLILFHVLFLEGVKRLLWTERK